MEYKESIVRLSRAQYAIDFLIQRYDYVFRIHNAITQLFDVNDSMEKSVHFAKNYISLLAFNFTSETDSIDQWVDPLQHRP